MSNKKRTSISVDEDVFAFLQQPEVNQSGLINDLVKQYRDNNDRQVAALKLRYEHLVSEAEDAEETAAKKRKHAQEVKELLAEAKATEREELQEARQALDGAPKNPDNPAVQNWADKLGMEPETLLDQL